MKSIYHQLLYISSIVFVLSFPSFAQVADPGEYLMQEAHYIESVLQNQNFTSKEEKESFEEKILAFLAKNFHWEEISRQTLKEDSNKFTQEELSAFTEAYRSNLESVCLGLATLYRKERIEFVRAENDEAHANVYLKFYARSGSTFDAVVRLIMGENTWQVYDIEAEGVSLVANYRMQFKSVLKRQSVEQLLKLLGVKSKR